MQGSGKFGKTGRPKVNERNIYIVVVDFWSSRLADFRTFFNKYKALTGR